MSDLREQSQRSADPTLAVARVTKSWPRMAAPVLAEVSLALAPGSRVRIVGANGAGKTTLLRVVTGLIRPESGTVGVEGLDPSRHREAVQRRVGFLSAGDRGLYARLTVRQHLDLWSRLALLNQRDRAPAVDRAVADFDLAALERSRADRLSMGQRQRLRIAMTFLHQPRLALLDEPMTSLDDGGAQLLGDAIDRTLAAGGACLWCSPGNDVAIGTFDGTLELSNGHLEPR